MAELAWTLQATDLTPRQRAAEELHATSIDRPNDQASCVTVSGT